MAITNNPAGGIPATVNLPQGEPQAQPSQAPAAQPAVAATKLSEAEPSEAEPPAAGAS